MGLIAWFKPFDESIVARFLRELHPSFTAPKLNVEPVTEAEALFTAYFCEPEAPFFERRVVSAFGHEQNTLAGQAVLCDEFIDLGKIGLTRDDEFEPGFW